MSLHIAIAAILAVSLFAARASAASDGQWWETLTENQKAIFVAGFFDGQTYTAKVFGGAMVVGESNPRTGKWEPARAQVLAETEKFAVNVINHDFGNLNAGQLVQGLNRLYADYRNSRILIPDAMAVVVRSMDGMSDDEIEKMLERKRGEAPH